MSKSEEISSIPKRSMKFHIILSKSMPIRTETDGGNIVSRGSMREFESTEKFQDPTEKTERCHSEPARKTASARSHEIMRERQRFKE